VKVPPPPIRFLLAVVGCWVGVRAFLLWPEAGGAGAEPFQTAAPPPLIADAAAAAPPALQLASSQVPEALPKGLIAWEVAIDRRRVASGASLSQFGPRPVPLSSVSPGADRRYPAITSAFQLPAIAPTAPPLAYPPVLPSAPPAALAPSSGASRWSGAAWVFVREAAGGQGLAPGGTLGGSQAGARLAYRVNGDARRPLSISARLYAPLERPQGAEAALGIDWQPIARLPLHILAERREKVGREGRSDFGVTVYGGGERRLLRGRLRLEAYGQAGVVGAEDRDLFADGSIRASTPIGPVEIGAGAWGGAQPGVARLDIGPQASMRIPIGRTAVRASAEWRFRVAGDAQPGSGPAITLATDF
jgi:hypothetical protein